ncbi:septal ring lytic transglycosylase RlpA family protein [candidate division KSB1 bacterium]|nr:septal ring lytic transglycosylase RlpA family protein [candidate division KSB1 bacterium]
MWSHQSFRGLMLGILVLLSCAYNGQNQDPAFDEDPTQVLTGQNPSSAPVKPKPVPPPTGILSTETGRASYYSDQLQGRSTASGEPYDRNKLTAAHRTLAFGTMVRVTNLANGKSVQVRINDRGPFAKNRIIDLSYQAAAEIDGIRAGVFEVKVEVLKSR